MMAHESDQAGVPLLSILLPVFNVDAYLEECIHSILAQTVDFSAEIILFDDASTDRSREIAERICTDQPGRVQLIVHRKNRGVSAARNTLLDAARGEYVWFLDPDDVLAAGALASLGSILDKARPDLILCDFSRSNGRKIASFHGPSTAIRTDREELVRGVFATRKLHCWSKISRRELWGSDLRFPDVKRFEDAATIPWLLLRANSYYYAPEAWVYYREHPTSLTALVARSTDFDHAGHDELAMALGDFHLQLARELGDISTDTRFAIAHFLAKAFRQIGYIALKQKLRRPGKIALTSLVTRYRTLTERSSPMTFDELAGEYRTRAQIKNYLFLRVFCWLSAL